VLHRFVAIHPLEGILRGQVVVVGRPGQVEEEEEEEEASEVSG
jgi:hypothetical protein